MRDGWYNEEFLALYESKPEAELATRRYQLSTYLPGYFAVGLKFWDDFIVCDLNGAYFSVPTVPLVRAELRPYAFPVGTLRLQTDAKLSGRIKWYIQPLVFGGSPSKAENIAWISHDQHVEAVIHWNKLYHELKTKPA